ncbi:hypothetical protein L9F63_009657 [Diploptera punctata]|uniref:HTH CENPB-type domain-containing protein n=1 Tax=Diploptera punctata TaxID=6984 RepID=A0AAD8ER12_DIPPU|nr:hypothetical protein L9F63_009657 [Diploptera punctata]
MSTEKKRSKYSLKEKFDILKRLDEGASAAAIARECGIAKTTIAGWRKKRTSIEGFVTTHSNVTRQILRAPTVFKWDGELFSWFLKERSKDTPISGPIIKEKALELNASHGGDPSFVASEGWLHSWKKKYNIQLAVCGDKLSPNVNVQDDYIRLSDTLPYNCDETSVNSRRPPTKTLDCRPPADFSLQEQHVPVIACSNVTENFSTTDSEIDVSKEEQSLSFIAIKSEPQEMLREVKSEPEDSESNHEIFDNPYIKTEDICEVKIEVEDTDIKYDTFSSVENTLDVRR